MKYMDFLEDSQQLYKIDRFKWFISQTMDISTNVQAQDSLEFAKKYLTQILEGKILYKEKEPIQPIHFFADPNTFASIERFRSSFNAFEIFQLDDSFTEEQFDDQIQKMIDIIQDAIESKYIDAKNFIAIKGFFIKIMDFEISRNEVMIEEPVW